MVIASGVLAVGISAILALLFAGSNRHRAAVDTTTAAMLASSVFEDISLNFFTTYRDRNNNRKPDVFEDMNRNGTEDRFESFRGAIPAADLMPRVKGYDYSIRIQYSQLSREVMVFCSVYWMTEGQRRQVTYRRTIFLNQPAR